MKNYFFILIFILPWLEGLGQSDSVVYVYKPKVSKYVSDEVRDSVLEEMTNYFKPLINFKALGPPKGYTKLDYHQIIKFKKKKKDNNWVIVMWATILLFILLMRRIYFNKVLGYLKALFNDNLFREGMDTATHDFSTFNSLMYTIKALVFSFVLFLFFDEGNGLQFEMEGWRLYVSIFLVVLLLLIIEKIGRWIFTYLLELETFHKNNALVHNSIDAIAILLLFPFSLVLYYLLDSHVGLGNMHTMFLTVFTLYSVFKLILPILKNRECVSVHKFLLLSYLCTFEILPYLILIRVINI